MAATVRGGFSVLPHVQAYADAVRVATGADSFGTYAGHDPSPQRALDIFASRELGDRIAEFTIANMDRYGIWYLIWRQRIYNPAVKVGWRDMVDRGSVTANHFDHVHISFDLAAAGGTPSTPATPQEDDDMGRIAAKYTFDGAMFVTDFMFRRQVSGPFELDLLNRQGVPEITDPELDDLHAALIDASALKK